MEWEKEAPSANRKKTGEMGSGRDSAEEEKVALNLWSSAKAAYPGPAVIRLGLAFTTLHSGSPSAVEGWTLQMAP